MSYILEAIRRSEEERRKRIVPSVSTIHAGPKARPTIGTRSGAVMILAAGAGLAVALVMAARSWPWPGSGDEMVAHSEAQAVAPAPAGDVATTTPAGDVAARATQPAPPEENAPTLSQTVPPPRPPDAAATAATATPGQAREPDAGAGAGERKTEHKKQPRTPYSASASAAPPARQAKAVGPRVAQPPLGPVESGDGPQNPLPAPTSEPAPEIVSATALAELPETVQRALPDIAITLHRYAATPPARMIRVNGRTAREGDALTEHLSVAEITRNGVVFTIDDQRFYMDAFQNWQAKRGS
ncbi:MAG: general secretion pathway protein GspB [Rhodospirillales bacterium]|nr:general secretion pathway protein GspB [Rhodospirillales bacterium]